MGVDDPQLIFGEPIPLLLSSTEGTGRRTSPTSKKEKPK